jgi:hypothetical protein
MQLYLDEGERGEAIRCYERCGAAVQVRHRACTGDAGAV